VHLKSTGLALFPVTSLAAGGVSLDSAYCEGDETSQQLQSVVDICEDNSGEEGGVLL
jgi:hypothetical protein